VDGESFSKFIKRFDIAASLNNWNQDAKAFQLAGAFTGDLQTEYYEKLKSDFATLSWSEIVAAMKAILRGSKETPTDERNTLNNLYQEDEETVESFIIRFKRQARRARYFHSVDLNPIFLTLMRPELTTSVENTLVGNPDASFRAICKYAINAQSRLHRENQRQQRKRCSNESKPPSRTKFDEESEKSASDTPTTDVTATSRGSGRERSDGHSHERLKN
jgi:hypothetical protein